MLFTTPLFIVDEEMGKKVHFGPIKTVFVATFFKFLTRNLGSLVKSKQLYEKSSKNKFSGGDS